jgi:hypothetical protein
MSYTLDPEEEQVNITSETLEELYCEIDRFVREMKPGDLCFWDPPEYRFHDGWAVTMTYGMAH